MKLIVVVFFIFTVFTSEAYSNGHAFDFLLVERNASAMGKNSIINNSTNPQDGLVFNPASLSWVSDENFIVGVSFNRWIMDNFNSIVYFAMPVDFWSGLVLGSSVFVSDYGRWEVTTVDNPDGTGEYFSTRDYRASVTASKGFVGNNLKVGLTLSGLYSAYYAYSSSGFAVDVGATYLYEDWMFGATIKNAGLQINPYTASGNTYPLPLMFVASFGNNPVRKRYIWEINIINERFEEYLGIGYSGEFFITRDISFGAALRTDFYELKYIFNNYGPGNNDIEDYQKRNIRTVSLKSSFRFEHITAVAALSVLSDFSPAFALEFVHRNRKRGN